MPGDAKIKEVAGPSQFVVACSPDKLIVRAGEAIRLRAAYATSLEGKPLQDTLGRRPLGESMGRALKASWDFSAVSVGVYDAKVSVKGRKRRIR